MADVGLGGQTSQNATINQFLTQLDGLRKKENNIICIAATNVGEHELDEAIMRAGRFERKIHVTRPNLKERKELFDFYLKNLDMSVDASVNTKLLSQKTLWFSPADIDYMVREASILAIRDSRSSITPKDLSEAYDRIAFGMKSNIKMNDKERLWTAYHEAGHAIIGYLLHPTDDVIKATIIPRKGSLGMVASRPQEELFSKTKEDLIADIKRCIAAYVAERIKFGSTSAGVGGGPGSDFYTAMRIAHAMVWRLGMGKSGYIGDFHALEGPGGWASTSGIVNMSEKTREILDADVQEILQSCVKDVEQILVEKKELLEFFAEELYKKEELEYDDIEAIFNNFGVKPLTRVTIA